MDSSRFTPGEHVELILNDEQRLFGDVLHVSEWAGTPTLELMTIREVPLSNIRQATHATWRMPEAQMLLEAREREKWLSSWSGRNRYGIAAAVAVFALLGAYWLGHRPVGGLESLLETEQATREGALSEAEDRDARLGATAFGVS